MLTSNWELSRKELIMRRVDQIWKDWEEADVLEDRREYGLEDIQSGLPFLTAAEVQELYDRLRVWWRS